MDVEQAMNILASFDKASEKIMILGVSDEYQYGEQRLKEIVAFFDHVFKDYAKRAALKLQDHGPRML
jgi:hypothetical protein